MKLSETKSALSTIKEIRFLLPNGQPVPSHFHITEIGHVSKKFIDCGGNHREENMINFQLYTAQDFDHRLSAEKLISIIDLSERQLNLPDHEVEVEYQTDTIGKFGLAFDGEHFHLTPTRTDCLANCRIPDVGINKISQKNSCCTPDAGCG